MSSVHHSVARICEICGKSCRTKKMLQIHLASHIDREQKNGIQCKWCGEWLQSNSGIYYHKQLHTSGPQTCNECKMELPNRMALQDHIRSHHKARNHKCNYCDKTFMTPYKLKVWFYFSSLLKKYSHILKTFSFFLASRRKSYWSRIIQMSILSYCI